MIFLSANQRQYTPEIQAMFHNVPTVWVPGQDEDIIFHGAPGYDVSIEIKRINTDLVESVIHGRLATQIARAHDAGNNIQFLATYGELDHDPQTGMARTRTYQRGGKSSMHTLEPHIMYQTLLRRIYTIMVKQNVTWIKGQNLKDMCDQITEWYWWWQAPPELHTSNETPYTSVYLSGGVPLTLRVAKELPRIGIKRAADVAKQFKSVREMVNAEIFEWTKIPGIGKQTAWEILSKPGWREPIE